MLPSPIEPRGTVRRESFLSLWWNRLSRWSLYLFVFSVALSLLTRAVVTWQLNRELDEIRALKQPLSLSQLQAPPIPQSQNAAPLYRQAAATLRYASGEENYLGSLVNKAAPLDARAQLILGRNRAALRAVREAAARSEWRSLRPISVRNELGSEMGEMRQLARLLHASAVWNAARGQKDAALGDVRAIFRMSHHLRHETSLIGFLVGVAIHAIANRALGDVLELMPLDQVSADAWHRSLPVFDWQNRYYRAMLGERITARAMIDLVRTDPSRAKRIFEVEEEDNNGGEASESEAPSAWKRWLVWPFVTLDEVQMLRAWKPYLRMAQRSLPAAFEDMERVAKIEDNVPFYAPMTRTLMPAFVKAPQFRDRAFVMDALRRTALDLSALRVREGRYPRQIALLGRRTPSDPFGGFPPGYHTDELGREFLLFSIGPNRRHEKGRRGNDGLQPTAPLEADDIVWNPPRRDFQAHNP